MKLLGFLTRKGLRYADIISAESESSLKFFDQHLEDKFVISVNGSDDEIRIATERSTLIDPLDIDNIAVAVGASRYKCIDDVYRIYIYLRKLNPELSLVIVGLKEDIPLSAELRKDKLVKLTGLLPQPQVCELLKKAKYYITATVIENSYNAASEGAYLSSEAYISDIGPHQELLKGVKFNVLDNLNTRVASLRVRREDLNINNLKSWNQVIAGMVNIVEGKLLKD